MNRILALAVVLIVGILCLALPGPMGWNPATAHTAMWFGIGCLAAFVYLLVMGIVGVVRVQSEPITAGGAQRRISVYAVFNQLEWYDWVILVVLVFGGFIIGMVTGP